MLVPARKMKAGAQKWVIQRVKKTPAVGPPAGIPEKTRTWSIAIRIMTEPRMRSTEPIRDFVVGSMASGVGARVALIGLLRGAAELETSSHNAVTQVLRSLWTLRENGG
jgi:hypothetical protein